MSVADQHGVNMSQSILWKPLDSSRLKILAHINDDGPELPSLVQSHKTCEANVPLLSILSFDAHNC